MKNTARLIDSQLLINHYSLSDVTTPPVAPFRIMSPAGLSRLVTLPGKTSRAAMGQSERHLASAIFRAEDPPCGDTYPLRAGRN